MNLVRRVQRSDLFRRAPLYVDRILRGAKVNELPVEFPTKFELVVNLKTAKAIAWMCRQPCSRARTR